MSTIPTSGNIIIWCTYYCEPILLLFIFPYHQVNYCHWLFLCFVFLYIQVSYPFMPLQISISDYDPSSLIELQICIHHQFYQLCWYSTWRNWWRVLLSTTDAELHCMPLLTKASKLVPKDLSTTCLGLNIFIKMSTSLKCTSTYVYILKWEVQPPNVALTVAYHHLWIREQNTTSNSQWEEMKDLSRSSHFLPQDYTSKTLFFPLCYWRRPFWGQNILLSEAVYHVSYAQEPSNTYVFEMWHRRMFTWLLSMEWYPSLFLKFSCQLSFPCRHMCSSETPSLHLYLFIWKTF